MSELSNLWAIHREEDECPELVGWARSESDANARLAELRARPGESEAPGVSYWVVPMTRAEVEDFKEVGAIPKEA